MGLIAIGGRMASNDNEWNEEWDPGWDKRDWIIDDEGYAPWDGR